MACWRGFLAPAPPAQVYHVLGAGEGSASVDPPLVAHYKGPNGVEIRSYSARWGAQEQLRAVYQELLDNLHGSEMGHLGLVNLWPEGGGGLYHAEYWSRMNDRGIVQDRVIDLFGADAADLDGLARILSHEYGHHFTIYYRWMRENKSFTYWKEGRRASRLCPAGSCCRGPRGCQLQASTMWGARNGSPPPSIWSAPQGS